MTVFMTVFDIVFKFLCREKEGDRNESKEIRNYLQDGVGILLKGIHRRSEKE